MKSSIRILFSLAAAVALGQTAIAAQLGDAAAPLAISEWVKGKPVDLAAAKGKQVVVVEFWATWCGPCRTSIPHLTEMQKKFKDVAFVGVTREDHDTVKKFVDKMGDQMAYTVAIDKDDGTSEGYMKAFGIGGIPHAFIVDKSGRIVWQGHPMAGLEEALGEIASGKFSLEKAKKQNALEEKQQQFFEAVSKDDKDPTLDKLASEITALEKEIGDIPADQKFNPAEVRKSVRFQAAMETYHKAMMAGKGDAELDKLGADLKAYGPKDFDLAEFKATMMGQIRFSEYYRALVGGADKETLAGLAKKVGDVQTKNVRFLNAMAWALLTDKKIQDRDYELATKLAKKAVDASEGKDANTLDTYARALFDSGKVADAVTWEKKAIAAIKDENDRAELEASLKKYEAKAAAK